MADTEIKGSQPRELGATRDAGYLGGSPVLKPGQVIRVHPITGQKYIQTLSTLDPMALKFPVPGLQAFNRGSLIDWEYRDSCLIDEADARDAQCRAGWSDTGYGFYGFHSERQPDGRHLATWKSGASCE